MNTKYPENQDEIYISELLTTEGNADTLDGCDSWQFFRSDVETTNPLVNNLVNIGSNDFKLKGIYINNINGLSIEYWMSGDKNNLPTIGSNGETGFDIGALDTKWKSIFAIKGHFETVYTNNLLKNDGTKFSHKELSDIGTNSHTDIDTHIASLNSHGATSENIAGRIASRDGAGTIKATLFDGTATRANYADLAEKYTCENLENIKIGTCYKVSQNEDFDVEICDEMNANNVIGIVSENPGFILNSSIEGVLLGLKGKVKALVQCPVKKGDILISNSKGTLISNSKGNKVAIANASDLSNEIKLIECIL